jgi:hypothetical protein
MTEFFRSTSLVLNCRSAATMQEFHPRPKLGAASWLSGANLSTGFGNDDAGSARNKRLRRDVQRIIAVMGKAAARAG